MSFGQGNQSVKILFKVLDVECGGSEAVDLKSFFSTCEHRTGQQLPSNA